MNSRKSLVASAVALVVTVAGSIAIAQMGNDPQPAEQPPMQLPPGWTQADMQACMEAATPGKQHEFLTKSAGTWSGKNTMWMYPGAEPVTSESKTVITPIMDGRFVKIEMSGDTPGMGAYNGLSFAGFDNVSQEFVSTWIDNMGTGIANGTGQLSDDGKVLTWTFTFNCPMTKKPVKMREVETIASENSKTLEMFMPDPKTGKEYKMMSIELTKK